jgi:23S rRNA (adenine2503-C2)-methyltransferase
VPAPVDLAALEIGDLETLVADWGEARFHARQIHRWIHARGVTDPARMSDLPGRLRDRMREAATVMTPEVVADQRSEDGTRKLVLGLADGRRIEAVYIPDTPKQTFCISTQVGCAMGCGFCLTGKMGLVRHLTAGEIVGQVRVLATATGLLGEPFNLVLMGMGEPLHNYDATMRAFRVQVLIEPGHVDEQRQCHQHRKNQHQPDEQFFDYGRCFHVEILHLPDVHSS